MRFELLLLLLLGVSCSTSTKNKSSNNKILIKKNIIENEKIVSPKKMKVSISPGDIKLLKLEKMKNSKEFFLCQNKKAPIFKWNNQFYLFWPESYFSKKKQYRCFIDSNSGDHLYILNFSIIPKKYPMERLSVNRKRVFLSKKDQKRVRKEQKMLNLIYSQSLDHPLFDKMFIRPIKQIVTSSYGKKRIFNNKKQTQHLGTDFRAPLGSSVMSSNFGRVAFS